ncbi:MAG: DUF58 domain-containing protein [Christensenellales bacterium]|jgi:uncharacterized protein (DUF58 family)
MNILWPLFVALVIILAQMLIVYFGGHRRLAYTRRFSKPGVYAGETVELMEVMTNDKWMPLPVVKVESRIPPQLRFSRQQGMDLGENDQYHLSLFALSGRRRVTRHHQVLCTQRGYYNLNSVTLTLSDALGILNRFKTFQPQAELLVYPQLLELGQLPQAFARYQGDLTVRRYIQPDPFLINGIRPYRPGDNLRDVHWGATARVGELQVKTHDYTAHPQVLIYLNIQESENLWGEMDAAAQQRMEQGIRLCATLAAQLLSQGFEVGFYTNADVVPEGDTVRVAPAGGELQRERIMRAMAHLRVRRKNSFHMQLDEDIRAGLKGLDIALVSCYMSPLLSERVGRLRAMGNTVTYLPIPDGEEAQAHG